MKKSKNNSNYQPMQKGKNVKIVQFYLANIMNHRKIVVWSRAEPTVELAAASSAAELDGY
jgi:hypothetical protein